MKVETKPAWVNLTEAQHAVLKAEAARLSEQSPGRVSIGAVARLALAAYFGDRWPDADAFDSWGDIDRTGNAPERRR